MSRFHRRSITEKLDFIDTQHAAETLQHCLAMFRQVQLGRRVAQTVVDETAGEIDPEVASQTVQGGFDVQSVVDDAVEYRLPHFVVILRASGLFCVTRECRNADKGHSWEHKKSV
jgi:hypothetical protein